MEKKEEQKQEVSVAPLALKKAKIIIKGKTPLLSDRFSEEVQKDILDKQTGKTKGKKVIRDIKREIERAIHYLPNGKVGFPAQGIIAGMIESTSFCGAKDFSKKLIRGLKIINTTNGLLEIHFKKQDVLEHRIGNITKFTPQFYDWNMEVIFEYDENNISIQDLIALINYAGFYYGLGSWSPRCKSGGNFGMYEVEGK